MLYLFSIVVCLLTVISAAAQDKKDFVLVKKDGNISIYERWIIFPKSNPPVEAREVKGEFTFKSTIAEAVKLLQNEKRISEWQHHVSEFKVYKLQDTTQWIEYSYHDIPWPVSDQDHLLIYTISRKGENYLFLPFVSKADPELAPVRKGVSRMELAGSWTFERINRYEVKATYSILSTPLNFPKFLTDPIIRNNMMTTIKQFIKILEEKK